LTTWPNHAVSENALMQAKHLC